MVTINYIPAGPVAQAFHDDHTSLVRGLMGPIGSGKSTACCMDLMMHALRQDPGDDGVSRSRAVIVRNTYPELLSTTIKTWLQWFPENVFGKIKMSAPIVQTLELSPTAMLEVVFLAMDRPDDIGKLLSLDTTWVWLNEARELPKEVLDAATGRVGRYPSGMFGAPTAFGVIMDTNPPPDDHWWYKLAEIDKPEGFAFFSQPGGLDPGAENLDFLVQTKETMALPIGHSDRKLQGRKYYQRLIPGKKAEWVKVFVHGRYGTVAKGRPVHPEFADQLHVAPELLRPTPGIPLTLGFDFGLTPACVITQMQPSGQLRILDEVVTTDSGLKQMIDVRLRPLLATKYKGFEVTAVHDPAGTQRSQANEITCRRILKDEGLNPVGLPDEGNRLGPRREAMSFFLTRLVDAGSPALLLSPSAQVLRKGLNGAYHFDRVNVTGESDRFRDVPAKTLESHICEALQYVALHFHLPGRKKPERIPPRRRSPSPLTAGY